MYAKTKAMLGSIYAGNGHPRTLWRIKNLLGVVEILPIKGDMKVQEPNIELILMTTMNCNMACDYCYVTDKKAGFLDLSLARKVIEQVVDRNDPSKATNIFWHGAEPLLVGIDYYKEIFSWTRQQYGQDKVCHHIQTNGTLLNDNWFDLFIQEHITTGVSLDGTRKIHDKHRNLINGRGSFDVVFNNICKAREKKLYFDALVVINRDTLGHEDELFDFFYENRIEFGFEPIVVDPACENQVLAITPQEYANCAIHLFDRWFTQPEPRLINVLPLYDFTMAVMRGGNTRCTFSPSCGRHYLTVAPDGKVYPCVRFGGESEFVFGNILRDSLEHILTSKKRMEFLKTRTDTIAVCRKCEWKTVCNSGCPHNAYSAFGTIAERDSFCASYKMIFDYISDRVKNGFEKAC
jgi:uncharacterized protein